MAECWDFSLGMRGSLVCRGVHERPKGIYLPVSTVGNINRIHLRNDVFYEFTRERVYAMCYAFIYLKNWIKTGKPNSISLSCIILIL